MAVATYNPQITVKLVKAVKRTEVYEGMPAVSKRYNGVDAIDLTPYLGEAGTVRISKGVRDPAGAFSVTLSDALHPELLETVYALIEPMDMIEIRAAHNAKDWISKSGVPDLPILMRGLVSNVTRNENMAGGKPWRTVTIAGQDFGKILQIILIRLLNNAVVGDNILSEFGFFTKYMNGSDITNKTVPDFLASVMVGIIEPFLQRVVEFADGRRIGVDKLTDWVLDCQIVEGTVTPYAVRTAVNVTLHQLLVQLLDVGPFNELFVEDRDTEIALVARPSPLYTPDRQIIQNGGAISVHSAYIDEADVQAINVTRSDSGVANYFWVFNSAVPFLTNSEAKEYASRWGSDGDYIQFDYLNCLADRYGIRFMEVETKLSPNSYVFSDAPTRDQVKKQSQDMMDWLAGKSALLGVLNRDNVVFETGTMRLRGNENIKAGCFLNVTRGGTAGATTRYYVTRVDHDFSLNGFFTSVAFERGTGFVDRAGRTQPVAPAEIDGGVY